MQLVTNKFYCTVNINLFSLRYFFSIFDVDGTDTMCSGMGFVFQVRSISLLESEDFRKNSDETYCGRMLRYMLRKSIV